MSPGDLSEALLDFYNCQKYITGARLQQDMMVWERYKEVPRSHDGLLCTQPWATLGTQLSSKTSP